MRRRLLPAVLACAVAVGAFGYRFLSAELTDDDYQFLAIGRQVQEFGEWPLRDLVEEGDPLHNVASAALLGVFGYRLAGEVFFDLALLALAAAVAFLVARDVSGSIAVSLAAVALGVLMSPRLYDYPKAVFPMLGLWGCLRYIHRPTAMHAAILGALTGVAFLFRHDLGFYLGVAASVTWVSLKLATGTAPLGTVRAYVIALALFVVPYLAYVQVLGGIPAYAAASQRFIEREVGRSDDPLPTFAFDLSRPALERSPGFPVKIRWAASADESMRVERERRYQLADGTQDDGRTWNYKLRDHRFENIRAIVNDPQIEDTANIDRTDPATAGHSLVDRLRRTLRTPPSVAVAPGVLSRNNGIAWLYYLFMALPYVVLAICVLPVLRRQPAPDSWMRIAPVVGLSAIAGPFWLRGNMYENSRLADLALPSAVLGAWLLAMAFRHRRPAIRNVLAVCAVAIFIATTGAVAAFANVRRGVDDSLAVLNRKVLSEEIDRQMAWLLASPPPLSLLSTATGMRGAAEYLQRCTAPSDRVFVYGFYPEVLFFSGRASAADRAVVLRGFWTRDAEQRRTIAALSKGPAPLALIDVETAGGASPDRFLDPTLAILDTYLSQHYREAGTTGFGGSSNLTFRVLVDRRRMPTGTYEPLSLPCFAAAG